MTHATVFGVDVAAVIEQHPARVAEIGPPAHPVATGDEHRQLGAIESHGDGPAVPAAGPAGGRGEQDRGQKAEPGPDEPAGHHGIGGPGGSSPDRPASGTTGRSGIGRAVAPRMPRTMTSAMPIPMSTSPTLNTLASGIPAGIAKMSVRPSSRGFSRTALLENPGRSGEPRGLERGPRRGHHPAVGDDGREVGEGPGRDEDHPRQAQVAQDGGEDRGRGGQVDEADRAHARRPTGQDPRTGSPGRRARRPPARSSGTAARPADRGGRRGRGPWRGRAGWRG